MRPPLFLFSFLLLCLACTRADNIALVDAFGSAFVTGWSGHCSDRACTMPDDCFWPGVRFARGSCNVTAFGAVGTVPQAVPFPSDIFGLTQISVLSITHFSFSGPLLIPPTYDYLNFAIPGGALLLLWNNFLSPWPPELNYLNNLANVDFTGNLFNGSAPDWWTPGVGAGGSSLESINLSFNLFDSLPAVWTEPTSICNFASLTSLNLAGNLFAGPAPFIPPAAGVCSRDTVTEVDISGNKFTSIPDIGTGSLLSYLASGNELSGSLPTMLGSPTLQKLDLGRNFFSGEWPASWAFRDLEELDISSNSDLNGPIPVSAFAEAAPTLRILRVANNNFSGPLPPFPLDNMTAITELDFSNNHFTSQLPTTGWVNALGLTIYSAANNQLDGPIPSEIGLAVRLAVLDLSNNSLIGTIPTELAQLTVLGVLNLANNFLSGSFPSWVLDSVSDFLDLRGNNFTGKAPAGLLDFLGPCDISGNPFLDTTTCAGSSCIGCECDSTDNCGPEPVLVNAGLEQRCCNGRWMVSLSRGALTPKNIEYDLLVYDNATCEWQLEYEQNANETLTLVITPVSFTTKRQNAEPLLHIDGEANFTGGDLVVIITVDPPEDTHTIMAVTSAFNLSGQFIEPVYVDLQFEGSSCISATATQEVGYNSIAVLVQLDRSGCDTDRKVTTSESRQTGLTRWKKVAIGVVCGILGLALLLMCCFCVLVKLAPDVAVAMGLRRPSTVTFGKLVRP